MNVALSTVHLIFADYDCQRRALALLGMTVFSTTFFIETRLAASPAMVCDGAGETGQAPSLHKANQPAAVV
ncbi:MAG TPA: hypothetical protein VKD23_14485 [Terriglobales bacterium]|nr:hypothetical protein [Terriglobales bacterium]